MGWLFKELRQSNPQMPIIMLTAKDDIVDKVLGLEMGADDTSPNLLACGKSKPALHRSCAAGRTTGDGKDETRSCEVICASTPFGAK
jgi:CheY-like chemotaxis protein